MTFREKLEREHPDSVSEKFVGGCCGCPTDYGYETYECDFDCAGGEKCRACWDREIPRPEPTKKVGSIEVGVEVKNCKDCRGAGGLRLCEVDGRRGYFHRFVEEEQGLLQIDVFMRPESMEQVNRTFKEAGVIPPGCSMEKVRHAWALVEFLDGTVKKVEPETVRFIDGEGKA